MSIQNTRVETYVDDLEVQKIEQRVNRLNTEMEKRKIHFMTIFNYAMHVTNLIMSNLGKAFRGTEAEMSIQDISAGLQIAQSEATFAMELNQAAIAFATGHPWLGGFHLMIAGLVQSNIFQLVQIREELARERRTVKETYMYYIGYSIFLIIFSNLFGGILWGL